MTIEVAIQIDTKVRNYIVELIKSKILLGIMALKVMPFEVGTGNLEGEDGLNVIVPGEGETESKEQAIGVGNAPQEGENGRAIRTAVNGPDKRPVVVIRMDIVIVAIVISLKVYVMAVAQETRRDQNYTLVLRVHD